MYISNLNLTGYSRQKNPVQTWKKNPVYLTRYFTLEIFKNQVQILADRLLTGRRWKEVPVDDLDPAEILITDKRTDVWSRDFII